MALLGLLVMSCSMVCFASTSHAKKESPVHQSGSYVVGGGVSESFLIQPSPAFDIQIAEMRFEYFDASPSIVTIATPYRFDNVAVGGKPFRGFPSETLARARTFDC